MVLLCSFHWIVLSLSDYFVDWKSGVSSHTFFFCLLFWLLMLPPCTIFHLLLQWPIFLCNLFYFMIYLLLENSWPHFCDMSSQSVASAVENKCEFPNLMAASRFWTNKTKSLGCACWLSENSHTGKKQMWLKGPDEIQMMVVLLPIVVKTLHNVEYWHFLTFNNGVQRALLIECSLVCCLR